MRPRISNISPSTILPSTSTLSTAVAENQPLEVQNRMSDSTTFADYAAQLRDFIRRHSAANENDLSPEVEFNRLALGLFALQFTHNAPYRQFCHARKVTPRTIENWTKIPALPAVGFKELEMTSLAPTERTCVFHSSGTTGQTPGRHFHNAESLALYEASLLPWFAEHLLPEMKTVAKANFLALTPTPTQARNSSLVHMFETVRRAFGSPCCDFTGQIQTDGAWNLDLEETIGFLRKSIADSSPLILLGTAFNYVHLLDHLEASGVRLQLPSGSRALETGGYKGRSRVVPKTELHHLITDWLGIPDSHVVCEYGMSELSSQAYDSIAGAQTTRRVFHFPPWARMQIISPETGQEVGEGETGLIRLFDLANVYSVMAIQTEDLGIRRGGGFELLGRAVISEPRGCSLQIA
jgi:Acyl-protein synthetase, LuxE